MKNMIEQARLIQDSIVNDRRFLHKNVECGMDLPKTKQYVRQRLESMGYIVEECGKSGIISTLGKGRKTILLRADMDGLNLTEINDLPFKSTNGSGHMCGHDMHTAMLLGAAKLLKDNESKLNGCVKFMFQPGEEYGLGAAEMIDCGVLDNPTVDAAFAIHVSPEIEKGKIVIKEGLATSILDAFNLKVTGKGGHGSKPEETIDPIFAINQVYNNLQGLVGREVSSFDNAVLTIGAMGGGTMENVIPDTAKMLGTLRSYEDKVSKRVMTRIRTIIENTCSANGVECDLFIDGIPAMLNDPDLSKKIASIIQDIPGVNEIINEDKASAGSEDFAFVSRKIPSVLVWMGIAGNDFYQLHDPKAIFDESNLYLGATIMAEVAVNFLNL